MTPEQLRQLKGLIRAGAGAEWAAADAAYQRVEQMARRDWAVRVLDAFCALRSEQTMRQWSHQTLGRLLFVRNAGVDGSPVYEFDGHDEVSARLAAAEAVWPELPESVRAEIGEKP